MAYSVSDISADNAKVFIRIREWDGIDWPDYIRLEGLTPHQARAWANHLNNSADTAEAFAEKKAQETLAGKLKELERLRAEIARLEKEVGDA